MQERLEAVKSLNMSWITINNGLIDALSDVDGVFNSLSVISINLENMTTFVNHLANDSDIHDTPSLDMIPTIEQQISDIQSARDAIKASIKQIHNSQLTVQDVNREITKEIDEARARLNNLGGELNGSMSEVKGYMESFNDYYGEVNYYVSIIDGVRLSVFITFWVLIFLIFTLGLVGLCCGWKWSVKLTACCTFTVPILFIIVAMVQLFLFIGLTDVCREGELAIRRSQSLIDKIFGGDGSNSNTNLVFVKQQRLLGTINNNNVTSTSLLSVTNSETVLNVSNLIDKVLYCPNDDSLLELIPGFDMNVFNFSHILGPVRHEVISELNQLNYTSLTREATEYLNEFSSYTSTVQMETVSSSMSTVRDHINMVRVQLSNFTQFGYDRELSNSVLEDLNSRTHDIGGDVVWSLDNVTNLDPTVSPYSSDTQYFNSTKHALLEYKDKRDHAMTRIAKIGVVLDNLTTNLNNIEAEVNQIISLINNTPNRVSTVLSGINSILDSLNKMISSLIKFMDIGFDQVEKVFGATLAMTGCKAIGQFSKSTKSNVCGHMGPYSGIISIASFMLAILTLVWFISILPLTKRVDNCEENKGQVELEMALLPPTNQTIQ